MHDLIVAVDIEESVNTGEQLSTDLLASSFNQMERDVATCTIARSDLSFVHLHDFSSRIQPQTVDKREGFFFVFPAGDRSELCHMRPPCLREIYTSRVYVVNYSTPNLLTPF